MHVRESEFGFYFETRSSSYAIPSCIPPICPRPDLSIITTSDVTGDLLQCQTSSRSSTGLVDLLGPFACSTCVREAGKLGSIIMTRNSEGYGTEEECVLSDPQGESDADADIEDADCRLQEPGSLQRISSRRRKRQRLARQDTTESEDDGGLSHASHRWNLRLSPDRTHSRTILEESISQVRPLIISRSKQREPAPEPRTWTPSLAPPLVVVFLAIAAAIASFLLPWVRN
ncbi:uncharacterized protein si:ch211-63p21.1 [Corythoichthys intestinalis]|uniref:uncharacterized protein si:ch211-63p21.1 n=1 Tax=Corythoichthys intestinalis TaxID=161448 RepID=UPI0025A54278|nr:uncharacterized protein si:ch211-63p21.1 [Corythoichthys intestinalis]